ncbi:MAG: hypothetical protein KFB97_13165 [Cyanobium sp. M30B3]|nr:MAG: hypothetical protein KFB97_13165 [Cyanobium sp. M30B3]
MSTVFNFWVLNLGSIGSFVNQGDLVDTYLLPEELETDQGFESEPDFFMEPDTSLDGSADSNPETLQEDALAEIGSLPTQDDLANSFLPSEEPETDQDFEPEPDFFIEPDTSLDGSADSNPEALQEDVLAEIGSLPTIDSLPNLDDLINSLLPPLEPDVVEEPEAVDDPEPEPDVVEEPEAVDDPEPEPDVVEEPEAVDDPEPEPDVVEEPEAVDDPEPEQDVVEEPEAVDDPEPEPDVVEEPEAVDDPEPEPDVVEEPEAVEEQEPAPAEPDGVAGPEAETAASETSSESSAGADPNPEAPDVAAESAPESTNSSSINSTSTSSSTTSTSTSTTSTSTSTSTSGGSSSMVTTSSVKRAEVTQLASAVVSIAAGIELRAGGKQGRNTFSFTLTRSGDSTGESSVAWAVRGRGDNPAAAQDFRGQQLPRGTVTFAAGETSRTVSVRVRPTDREKGFTLRLDKARGAVLGRSQARATIAPRDKLIGTDSDDRIQGSRRADVIEGGRGQDLLTGGGKADQFGFRYGDSQIGSPDRITDFRFGKDRIALLNGKGRARGLPRRFSRAADNSSASSLEDLAAAVFADANGRRSGNQALGRREAALVVSTNAQIAGTYLLINNGKAGLNPRRDLLIEVSGFSGGLPGLGRIDPGLVFG